jgi:adenylate cyclase class IV
MEELSTYLNDHLAGSIGALELLDRLIETYQGKPLERFFQDLRNEIEQDQEQLRELIQKLGVEESAVRKAGAWIAEKLSRSKIELDDSSERDAGLFLALEALVLGITGKRSLWRALQSASRTMPELARLDYAGLEKRAIEQCERVEARRLETARTVFNSK